MQDDTKQPILSHLDEFRSRLVKSLIAVAVSIVICVPLVQYIIPILAKPGPDIDLYYTEVTGLISSYFIICLYAGLVIAAPYLLYQLVMFVNPALTRKEKGYLYTFLPGVLVLFVGGILFCYFILLPPALTFLYETFPSYVGGDIEPLWTINNYISVITRLLFWIGVVFEIPLVMFFLSKLRVISPEWIARKWRWAFVGAFLLGAIITPTFDPLNQTLVAAPILVLYGLGYVLAVIARTGLPFRSKKPQS
ncbi:MAG: twin-arginine translocase subunit TatC [Chloroflexota bacterium]|nr:twin-arginine translocase subunit TatC [Chloroflexota bacterium]